MTESSGAITEDSDHSPRQGSVGRIVDGNIVKVNYETLYRYFYVGNC